MKIQQPTPTPRKRVMIAVRVTDAQAGVLRAAADSAGVTLSEWVRSVAVQYAAATTGDDVTVSP